MDMQSPPTYQRSIFAHALFLLLAKDYPDFTEDDFKRALKRINIYPATVDGLVKALQAVNLGTLSPWEMREFVRVYQLNADERELLHSAFVAMWPQHQLSRFDLPPEQVWGLAEHARQIIVGWLRQTNDPFRKLRGLRLQSLEPLLADPAEILLASAQEQYEEGMLLMGSAQFIQDTDARQDLLEESLFHLASASARLTKAAKLATPSSLWHDVLAQVARAIQEMQDEGVTLPPLP